MQSLGEQFDRGVAANRGDHRIAEASTANGDDRFDLDGLTDAREVVESNDVGIVSHERAVELHLASASSTGDNGSATRVSVDRVGDELEWGWPVGDHAPSGGDQTEHDDGGVVPVAGDEEGCAGIRRRQRGAVSCPTTSPCV